MRVRELQPNDLEALVSLVRRVENFSDEESACAVEMIDGACRGAETEDYEFWCAVEEGDDVPVGYICFGPASFSTTSYDLYWIAVDPRIQGRGVGSQLLRAMEEDMGRRGVRWVLIETSSTPAYEKTVQFYRRHEYGVQARIADYYKVGDDKLILGKRIA